MKRFFKSKASAWMLVPAITIPSLLFMALTAEARTWTDIKGRTLEAEFIRAEKNAALVKKNGKEVRLPLQTLSAADQQFITKRNDENKAAKTSPAATLPSKKESLTKPSSTKKEAPSKPGATKGSDPYYSEGTPIFNPYPETIGRGASKPWLVKNLGPVGIGIHLIRPGMTMQINNVEEGSPAHAAGKLQKGQIIESINGKVLEKIDPRIILGDIVTEAEATDGKIVLKIKDVGDVTVKIPVMGTYSPTWPLNCPKTDKIVRNLADMLAKDAEPKWGSMIFLLSTGEEKDLAVVRKWMKNLKTVGVLNWHKGYIGPALCEYYLRTGDESALPIIKQMTEEIRIHMYSGGWSGRGAPAAYTYSTGSGQLHAAGVHCMNFLMMAKLCGVEVDKYMFDQTFSQFYRFAGHGNVPYGNGAPEGGFRDNGKTSGLALMLGSAAMLSSEGEDSVYAKARDNSAMKAFYATNWFHAAHTGGGMGEIWHHSAISQMREKRPAPYRSYLDSRRWVMDLSRRFDGSIGIAGMDDRYDASASESNMDFGTFFALTYTYPRKQLQLFGAPRSKWAKNIDLPRPWGNTTDDVFQSIEPIAGGTLTLEDLMNEQVGIDDSLAINSYVDNPDVTDETLLKYLHHPEYDIRVGVMKQITKLGRAELVLPLLKSSDARLRQAGLLAFTGMFKGTSLPDNALTPEMFAEVSKMVDDPNESWWVAQHAILALARNKPEVIAKHRDRLMALLEYNCTWIQTAAVVALAKISTQPDHYKTVLPVILDKSASFRVVSATRTSADAIAAAMKSANSQVKTFAAPYFKKTYAAIPGVIKEPNTGAMMRSASSTIRSGIGNILQLLPEGEEFVKKMPRTTLASFISGKDADKYTYNGKFSPNNAMVGNWAWCVYPAPSKPSEIEPCITKWLKSQPSSSGELLISNAKDTIQLLDDGKVTKSKFFGKYFWSGDMLISMIEDQALKMEIRNVQGHDFLIIERGEFHAEPTSDEEVTISKDWHCGYHVYVRQK